MSRGGAMVMRGRSNSTDRGWATVRGWVNTSRRGVTFMGEEGFHPGGGVPSMREELHRWGRSYTSAW